MVEESVIYGKLCTHTKVVADTWQWKNTFCSMFIQNEKSLSPFEQRILSHCIQKKWSKWYANNKVIHLTFLMKILLNEKKKLPEIIVWTNGNAHASSKHTYAHRMKKKSNRRGKKYGTKRTSTKKSVLYAKAKTVLKYRRETKGKCLIINMPEEIYKAIYYFASLFLFSSCLLFSFDVVFFPVSFWLHGLCLQKHLVAYLQFSYYNFCLCLCLSFTAQHVTWLSFCIA